MAYIITALAAMFFLQFIYLLFKSLETKKWRAIEGEILSKELDKGSFKSNESHLYTANIKYSYTINGKEFVSKRIFYGSWIAINTPFGAQDVLGRYKKSSVTVYYNPNSPKESVLEKGVNCLIYRLLLVGVIFVVVAYFLEIEAVKI